MSSLDLILDLCKQNIEKIPQHVLDMSSLRMLYLSDNALVTLPDDFFMKLQHLTWLDLRNNQLVAIPETIAYHQFLENLLLSNNCIEYLPNEMGLIPNLKVLQLGGNPLIYPGREIVEQGTKAVCEYLKSEYGKSNSASEEDFVASIKESRQNVSAVSVAINREKHKNGKTQDRPLDEITTEEKVQTNTPNPEPKKVESKSMLDALSAKSIDQLTPNVSSLTIKCLSAPSCPKIVHHISKSATKTCLKSFYDINVDKQVKKATQTSETLFIKDIKDEYFEKVKILLAEQEKILQQEKNLKLLDGWQEKRKKEPMRHVRKDELAEVPYGTDPAYNTMLSREELSREVERMIDKKNPPEKATVQKLINDLASELKNMQINYGEGQTNHSEMELATRQMQFIMDIHRKLLKLQESNQTTL